MRTLVSVIMPVYNAERYLREAIESILTQTHHELEFLIIDDGSTDSSAAIVRTFDDPRIRFIQNESNLKICNTLNRGLELATGDFIARMDADDFARPHRLATQLQFLQSHPDLVGVGAWMRTTRNTVWKTPVDSQELRPSMYFRNCLFHPTAFFRAEPFRNSSLRYDQDYLYAEEWELWFRMMRQNRIGNVPHVLLDYRLHADSSVERNRSAHNASVARLLQREWSRLDAGLTTEQIGEIVRHDVLMEPILDAADLCAHGRMLVTTAYRALVNTRISNRFAAAKVINRQLYRLHANAAVAAPAALKAYASTLMATDRVSKLLCATGLSRFLAAWAAKQLRGSRLPPANADGA
jgi:glycosyltransferase involved in cell wall biosynthesis